MAGGAAVHNAEFRMPYLLQAKLGMALQCQGIRAGADHLHIFFLIVPPLAEMVLGWSNCQRDEKNDAHGAECTRAVAKQPVPETAQLAPLRHLSSSRAIPTTIRGRGKMCRRL